MSNSGIIKGIIFSILPVFELRGGIPVAIASGASWFSAFFFCVGANILVIGPIFFFLDYIHEHLMKIRTYNRVFNLYLNRVRKKAEEKFAKYKWEYFVLFLFVAIPMPGTGAYTGCLIAWFFELDRKKSYISIALGVITAGIVVTIVATAANYGFLKIFIKE